MSRSAGESIDSLLAEFSERCARVSTLRALLTDPHSHESLKLCRQTLEHAEKALIVTKSQIEIEKSNLKLAQAFLEGLKAQSVEIEKLIQVVQTANLGIKSQSIKQRGGMMSSASVHKKKLQEKEKIRFKQQQQ
jgi:hypothetical protein